ncbi:MAG: hypothetical protein KAX25_03840, partial [Dehalococcoidia bacterium]|nr:hypothetical protein [Dehalococcoidia bacterium]
SLQSRSYCTFAAVVVGNLAPKCHFHMRVSLSADNATRTNTYRIPTIILSILIVSKRSHPGLTAIV